MNRTWIAQLACVVALVVSALGIPYAASTAAQKAAGGSAAAEGKTKARRVRLPNYYAGVTNDEQRTKLRAILHDFAPQIQQKREELQALIAKRNAALDEILTPEQRQEIAKLRAEAAARRKAGGSAADGKGKAKKAKAGKGKSKKAA
jgi:Spy/CpxP family protein refolding chaperone